MSNGFKQNGKESKDLKLVSFFTGCLKNILGVPGYKVSSKVEIHRIYQHNVQVKNKVDILSSAWFINIDKCTLIRAGSFFLRHHVEVHLDLTRLCTAQTAEMEGN